MFKYFITFAISFTTVPLVAQNSATIQTIAGAGQSTNNGNQGSALKINIGQTFGVEFDPQGVLYICEVQNHRVFRYDPKTKQVTTFAGNGQKGYAGDGGPAARATMNEPYEVRFDPAGNMFVVEMKNHIVRRVDANTGVISTIAGTGEAGYSGDGGPATKAKLNRPHSIALDKHGHLYIADIGNHRIRRVNLEAGTISTFAGNGERELPNDGDELSNAAAVLGPRALFILENTMWLALREGHSVWSVDLLSKKIQHIAGTGEKGYVGDGGAPRLAKFNGPKGIVADSAGHVFVVDTENQVVRDIDTRGNRISTLAGNGKRGFGGDNGDALAASMDRPHGICIDRDGNVYIGDTNNHRVRMVSESKLQ